MKVTLNNGYTLNPTRVYRGYQPQTNTVELNLEFANGFDFDELIAKLPRKKTTLTVIDGDETKEYEGFTFLNLYDAMSNGDISRITYSKELPAPEEAGDAE